MKHCLALLALLLFAACAAAPSGSDNHMRIVKNGSPCANAGEIAHDASGGFIVCKEKTE